MKAIQITMDEKLLRQLDDDPEVKELGRSAVIRRALGAHLRQQRKRRVADAYRLAYGRGTAVQDELEGWADEATWPDA